MLPKPQLTIEEALEVILEQGSDLLVQHEVVPGSVAHGAAFAAMYTQFRTALMMVRRFEQLQDLRYGATREDQDVIGVFNDLVRTRARMQTECDQRRAQAVEVESDGPVDPLRQTTIPALRNVRGRGGTNGYFEERRFPGEPLNGGYPAFDESELPAELI
jgi:hypothetical protein